MNGCNVEFISFDGGGIFKGFVAGCEYTVDLFSS
jgi:hypothetical protein